MVDVDPNVYPVTAEFVAWFNGQAAKLKVTSKVAEATYESMRLSLLEYEHGTAEVEDLVHPDLRQWSSMYMCNTLGVFEEDERNKRVQGMCLDTLADIYKDLLLQMLT